MDRGVTEIRDFIDTAQFFEDLCPNSGGLDLAVAGFQIVHAWNCCSDQAATALRGALFFGFLSANSKPTFPFSNLRCAENGRPFLETNFGRRSVLPVVISFCTCSFGISRCRMFLLIRNVQVFSLATAFSQA